MGYAHATFTPVKPHGKYGDRSNDGFVRGEGIYFQVYAPDDISNRRTISDAASKIVHDYEGLNAYWEQIERIRRFRFVLNDKYKGAPPALFPPLAKLQEDKSLAEASVFLSKDLENTLFRLEDDQIKAIISFLPQDSNFSNLDYSATIEVIEHILSAHPTPYAVEILSVPDFREKIRVNEISVRVAIQLQSGSLLTHMMDDYFRNQGDFIESRLRDDLNSLYLECKENIDQVQTGLTNTGDHIMMQMLKEIIPRENVAVQHAAWVILAYYFESCDVFEAPSSEVD